MTQERLQKCRWNLLEAGSIGCSGGWQQFSLTYINKMNHPPNYRDQGFQNLLTQIKIYLKSKDTDSLEYLLEDQDPTKLNKIRQNLTPKEQKLFDQITDKLTKSAQQDKQIHQPQTNPKVQAALFHEKEDNQEEVLQNFEKQYKLTDIIYGQNYSYPFLALLEKMSSVYFYRSHPNPFPESSLKMLHSIIQTLFSYVFNPKITQNYHSKNQHHKKNFHHYLKEYLFFVFEKQYQKFSSFHKLFKSIKSSLSNQEISEQDLILQKSKSLENAPLTSTQNLEELEYFQKISREIKNEGQFKEFSKIKCLNFLYFGEKRLKQLIDPEQKFLVEQVQKQILQLISFVLCRFVRKVILGCIKKTKAGKLEKLENDENIESVEVKIIGNQLIDEYSKKVDNYLKLDEPIEEIAKRTFLRQFYEYEYQRFVPRGVIEQSAKKLQNQKKSQVNLPQEIWITSKYYQSLWIQRIAAEQYIRKNFENQHLKREKGKRNDYSNYIKQNFKEFEENPALLWIKYLTLIHKGQVDQTQPKDEKDRQKQEDIGNSVPKGKKKVKLQSLSN